MAARVRTIHDGEQTAFVRSSRVPFLDPFVGDPDQVVHDEREAQALEVDRTWIAEDGGRFVANACVYSRSITVPAAPGQPAPVVPFAAVSAVGVHPTHRRQGLLRTLMAAMLADAVRRGEVLAGLLASESVIYGRFGFGHATSAHELEIDTARSAFVAPAPPTAIRLVDAAEAAELLPGLFDRARRVRAGEPDRDPLTWSGLLDDSPGRRRGASALFHAVTDEGFVSYRIEPGDMMRARDSRVVVHELRATSTAAEAALWRFVLDLDLVGSLRAARRPVDEPLRWRLADPRRLRVTAVDDRLWVRVLDVPGALLARGYRRPGRLGLEVVAPGPTGGAADPAAGRWVLDAGPDGASCRPARPGEAVDLRVGVADLGSLYLGGFRASELARGGRVEELAPGGIDAAEGLLSTWPAPSTATGF